MSKSIDETWSDADVDAIYKAYPRHVAPIAAKRAIRKALSMFWRNRVKEADEDDARWAFVQFLLARTESFAASPAGRRKKQWVPYPATWFNRGSYDEDESEWQVGDPVVRGLPPRPDKYEGL